MRYFITSDTHFNGSCYLPDNYTSLQVNEWKSTVTNDDIVIHCGDVHSGPWKQCKEIMEELPGYKILVKGNHDGGKNEKYKEIFSEVYESTYTLDDIVFSHVPVNVNNYNVRYNIFGHFHVYPINENVSKIRRYKDYYDSSVHYPICIWDWNWRLPLLTDFKNRFFK